MMRRALAGLIFAALMLMSFLSGCTSHPKPQPPQPPKPTPPPVVETGRPTSPIFTNLLLRQAEGKLQMNGKPFRMVGAIPCWPESDDPGSLKVDGKSVGYDWPLVANDFIDAVKAKGVNAVHIRLLLGGEPCCGLQGVGGPQNADGSWNPKFWDRVHAILRHAGDQGFVVEVDVLDGWIIKHCAWGDPVCPPWPAQDIHGATKLPLNPSVVKWVAKVVEETRFYGNVVYQIGNENEGIPGWSPEWERVMHAEIRKDEQGGVVHMIGSCSRDFAGPYDYFTAHDADPQDSPVDGRPLWVNEQNPAKTVATFKRDCDAALARGTACWLWRSDGKDNVWQASLDSINGPVETGCTAPLPDRSLLTFSVKFDSLYGGSYDATPLVTRSCAYCASLGMGTMAGDPTPRCTCPVRNEGQPDRLACEQYVMQAAAPVWFSDGQITKVDTNGFRVRATGTWLEACDGKGEHCTRVPVQ